VVAASAHPSDPSTHSAGPDESGVLWGSDSRQPRVAAPRSVVVLGGHDPSGLARRRLARTDVERPHARRTRGLAARVAAAAAPRSSWSAPTPRSTRSPPAAAWAPPLPCAGTSTAPSTSHPPSTARRSDSSEETRWSDDAPGATVSAGAFHHQAVGHGPTVVLLHSVVGDLPQRDRSADLFAGTVGAYRWPAPPSPRRRVGGHRVRAQVPGGERRRAQRSMTSDATRSCRSYTPCSAERVRNATTQVAAPVAEIHPHVLDVRDTAAVEAFADEIRDSYGGVDIVFSSAAARLTHRGPNARDRRQTDLPNGTLIPAVCPGLWNTGASRPCF
jgi:hypothetical protein